MTTTLIPRAPATGAAARTQRGRYPALAMAIGLVMLLAGGFLVWRTTTDAPDHHATNLLASAAAASHAPAAASPSHTLTGFTAAQQATLDWALGLFDEAGLPLPGIDFVLHTTVEPCHGRRGWYSGAHDRPVIRVCTHEGGPVPEPLILHERAHAWDGHLLTDQRRASFLDWRGLTQWWGDERDHWGRLRRRTGGRDNRLGRHRPTPQCLLPDPGPLQRVRPPADRVRHAHRPPAPPRLHGPLRLGRV